MEGERKMIRRKYIPREPAVVRADDIPEDADVTDEIAKSLLELKDAYDLPTEEVERAIDSRVLSKRPTETE
jgi:hypothetical protein